MMDVQSVLEFLPPELRNRRKNPYYLPLFQNTAIAGGASIDLTTPLQNVAAYLITRFVGRVYTAAAPETSVADPALTVFVRFSSGDNLTNGAVIWSAVVGDAGSFNAVQGGALEAPRLVPGGSTITVTVASYALVATSYLVRLTVNGINVYST